MQLVSWQEFGVSEDSVVVVDFDDSKIFRSLDFLESVARRDLKLNS